MMHRLPADPPLDRDPAARAALMELLEQAEDPGVLRVPRGSPRTARPLVRSLVRWLYRGWLAQEPHWRPLVEIDPTRVPPARWDRAWSDSLEVAREGWLFLDEGWRRQAPEATLVEAARAANVRLVLTIDGPDLPLPASAWKRIAWLDGFHLPATDPSLRHLRPGLLAHCRAAGVVCIAGPSGTGKRSLARWAHAVLDDRPLSRLCAGQQDRLQAGHWLLIEEIGQLEAARLEPLRQRLEPPAPAPFAPAGRSRSLRRPPNPAFAPVIGESEALRQLLDKIARYAPSALPILVRGPTGSGKEVLARAIHDASRRRGPYVAIDLSAVSETLVESALFGHVRGAFTGAERDRAGAFQEAGLGTIFIDELGNLSPAVQAKLLRVLETGEVRPLGSDRSIPVSARIVAATNANLEAMVQEGRFREDLLFRFNPSATLWVPPLSDRPDDILPLALAFLRKARSGSRTGPEGSGALLSPEAEDALLSWHWPGNVRELRHVMEAAAIEAGDGPILAAHLGPVAPQHRREVPYLVTTSDPPAEWERWAIPRPVRQELTVVTVQLPPLRERSPLAIRNAVLASLGGLPITPAALAILERCPWWGEYMELERTLEALRLGAPGIVDTRALQACLPQLLQDGGRAPIRVLMFPTVRPDGKVDGLHQVFHEEAVVVGRARHLSDLHPDSGSTSQSRNRLERRYRYLQRLLGQTWPGLVQLAHIPGLGRAHLVLTREGTGLAVHALPGTELPVEAGPMEATELHLAHPEEPVEIGSAGEVCILDPSGDQALVRIFVFAGEVALQEALRPLRERLARDAAAASDTQGSRVRFAPPASAQRVRALRSLEAEALAEAIDRWLDRGGAFATSLRSWARSEESTSFDWLRRYLDSSHPTQSCVRLFSFEGNELLRDEMLARLQARGDAEDAWARLPAGIRAVLPAP